MQVPIRCMAFLAMVFSFLLKIRKMGNSILAVEKTIENAYVDSSVSEGALSYTE